LNVELDLVENGRFGKGENGFREPFEIVVADAASGLAVIRTAVVERGATGIALARKSPVKPGAAFALARTPPRAMTSGCHYHQDK